MSNFYREINNLGEGRGKGRSRGEGGSGCQNPTSPARYAISLRDLARSTGKKEGRTTERKEGREEECCSHCHVECRGGFGRTAAAQLSGA